MNDIVYGNRVNVEVAKGDTRIGIFRNYSGKGDGAWIDFPDTPELSDFYPMSAITELFDEDEANAANARLAAETERAIRNHPNNKD